MTPGLLYEAFHALRRQAAVGIDGVDWDAYADGVYARLADLHERVQSGRYRAQPARKNPGHSSLSCPTYSPSMHKSNQALTT